MNENENWGKLIFEYLSLEAWQARPFGDISQVKDGQSVAVENDQPFILDEHQNLTISSHNIDSGIFPLLQ